MKSSSYSFFSILLKRKIKSRGEGVILSNKKMKSVQYITSANNRQQPSHSTKVKKFIFSLFSSSLTIL